MTGDDLIDKRLEELLVAIDGLERQRFHAALAGSLALVTAIEPNPERAASAPEPVAARRGDQGMLGSSQRRVQIDLRAAKAQWEGTGKALMGKGLRSKWDDQV